jgi:hypothetical protein
MTDAERQRRRYARRKAGLVRVEAWVPAEAEDAVRRAIDQAVKDAAEDVERIKGDEVG